MAKIDLREEGWIKDNFESFRLNFESELKKYSSEAVKSTSVEVKRFMKDKARSKFKVKKNTFLNTFSSHIYNTNPKKLDAVMFYNKIEWFPIFDSGGKITKRVIIPFPTAKRIKRATFKKITDNLKENNSSFFKKVNGQLILFAKTEKSNTKVLSAFRKQYRTNNNIKSIKKGTIIPIGIVLNSVTLKKKFNFNSDIKPYAEKSLFKNLRVKINFK